MSALPNILQQGCGKLQEPGLYSHLLPPALGTVAVVAEKRNWRHLDSLQNQVELSDHARCAVDVAGGLRDDLIQAKTTFLKLEFR